MPGEYSAAQLHVLRRRTFSVTKMCTCSWAISRIRRELLMLLVESVPESPPLLLCQLFLLCLII